MPEDEQTYAAAGVSLATADAVVERLRAAVESTGATGFGAFAGLFPLDEQRLLAASMDSIGTKPIVARPRGALRACGADMAAHCINDVITTGADPLFLLDYVAAGRIDLEDVAELVSGAADVCRAAGVALLGGETAELPDVYREDGPAAEQSRKAILEWMIASIKHQTGQTIVERLAVGRRFDSNTTTSFSFSVRHYGLGSVGAADGMSSIPEVGGDSQDGSRIGFGEVTARELDDLASTMGQVGLGPEDD